jgi:uncharacterized C2H2 Zn-finger protein
VVFMNGFHENTSILLVMCHFRDCERGGCGDKFPVPGSDKPARARHLPPPTTHKYLSTHSKIYFSLGSQRAERVPCSPLLAHKEDAVEEKGANDANAVCSICHKVFSNAYQLSVHIQHAHQQLQNQSQRDEVQEKRQEELCQKLEEQTLDSY